MYHKQKYQIKSFFHQNLQKKKKKKKKKKKFFYFFLKGVLIFLAEVKINKIAVGSALKII